MLHGMSLPGNKKINYMNCIFIFGDKISCNPGWPQISCRAEDNCRLLILLPQLCAVVTGVLQHPRSTVLRTRDFVHVSYTCAAELQSEPTLLFLVPVQTAITA